MIRKTDPQTENDLLDKVQLAQRLGLTPRSIDNYVAFHALPHIKLSARCLRFRWNDIESWLDARAQGGAQ